MHFLLDCDTDKLTQTSEQMQSGNDLNIMLSSSNAMKETNSESCQNLQISIWNVIVEEIKLEQLTRSNMANKAHQIVIKRCDQNSLRGYNAVRTCKG